MVAVLSGICNTITDISLLKRAKNVNKNVTFIVLFISATYILCFIPYFMHILISTMHAYTTLPSISSSYPAYFFRILQSAAPQLYNHMQRIESGIFFSVYQISHRKFLFHLLQESIKCRTIPVNIRKKHILILIFSHCVPHAVLQKQRNPYLKLYPAPVIVPSDSYPDKIH